MHNKKINYNYSFVNIRLRLIGVPSQTINEKTLMRLIRDQINERITCFGLRTPEEFSKGHLEKQ